MYGAPSGTAPRVCVGILANAHATGATSHTPVRLVGQVRGGRAQAAGRLQRGLKAYRGVPPVEHDRGVRQRLALQPPQPGIASHNTVAGVSAVTPAAASAFLNASDAIAGLLRAKTKRDWFPAASMTLPAISSKCRSSRRCRLRT